MSFSPVNCLLHNIDNVTIVVPFDLYFNDKKTIDSLISRLHDELNAIRTIGDINLSDDVDIIKDEFLNTQNGIFGKYSFDLIREV